MTTSTRSIMRAVSRAVLQSAADLSITMIAGGNHTEIKMVIGPYKAYTKQLDKLEFITLIEEPPHKKETPLDA